jgi:hypothetical protein
MGVGKGGGKNLVGNNRIMEVIGNIREFSRMMESTLTGNTGDGGNCEVGSRVRR